MPAGVTAADSASELDRAGVEQEFLGQRRLAGVRVRDDGKRAPPRDLSLDLDERRWRRRVLRLFGSGF